MQIGTQNLVITLEEANKIIFLLWKKVSKNATLENLKCNFRLIPLTFLKTK